MNDNLKQILVDFLDFYSKLDYDNNKDLYDETQSIFTLNEIWELQDAMERFSDDKTILTTSFENRILLIIKGKITKVKAFNEKAVKIFPKTEAGFGLMSGEDVDIQF